MASSSALPRVNAEWIDLMRMTPRIGRQLAIPAETVPHGADDSSAGASWSSFTGKDLGFPVGPDTKTPISRSATLPGPAPHRQSPDRTKAAQTYGGGVI